MESAKDMRVTGSQKEESCGGRRRKLLLRFLHIFGSLVFLGFLFLFLLFPSLIQTVICEKSENFKEENENES